MLIDRLSLVLTLICLAATIAMPASAQFADGTILVTDSGTFERIIAIDPMTGDRTVISDDATGSGPGFSVPAGIAINDMGTIFVADASQDLFSVDALTGNRTKLSNDFIGSGPEFGTISGLTIDANGNILVADTSYPGIFSVDPQTGDRTVVSGYLYSGNLISGEIGTGSPFNNPTDLAIDANGNILVTDPGLGSDRVISVNPITGDRTIVSSNAGVGTGQSFGNPTGIAIDASGNLLISDPNIDTILSIDPTTGDRSVLSSDLVGAGTSLNVPIGIAVDPNGQMLVADASERAIFIIDPTTGDRVELSGPNVGSGVALVRPQYLAVVPEPGSATLIGLASLALIRRRRK